jgi:hypothetical protein
MSKEEQIIMENSVKGDVDTGIELSIFQGHSAKMSLWYKNQVKLL